jgi:hypothetical protein
MRLRRILVVRRAEQLDVQCPQVRLHALTMASGRYVGADSDDPDTPGSNGPTSHAARARSL